MSIAEFPTNVDHVHINSSSPNAADHYQLNRNHSQGHRHPCVSSKRKLDEYAPNFDDDDEDEDEDVHLFNLVSVRMKRGETCVIDCSSDGGLGEGTSTDCEQRDFDALSTSLAAETSPEPIPSSCELQFFVRTISAGNTMVMLANINDTVMSLHERIQAITRIPIFEQRLIYRGRQLRHEQTLLECSIQNNAELQLVGRMRSTEHPKAWQIVDDMVSLILRLYRGETVFSALEIITTSMTDFLSLATATDLDQTIKQLQIFLSLSAPAALVMLYLSPMKGNKECADNLIKHFMDLLRHSVSKQLHKCCAIIALEFCNLLRRDNPEDSLYILCRSTLGSLLEADAIACGMRCIESVREPIKTLELIPFVDELANKLSIDLSSSIRSPTSAGPSATDIRDFTAFSLPLHKAIEGQLSFHCSKRVPLYGGGYRDPSYGEEGEFLYNIYLGLLKKMDMCLQEMQNFLVDKEKGDHVIPYPGWSQYLAILEKLNSTSHLFQGLEEEFWTIMKPRKSSICELIVRFAKRGDDYSWILCHKDVMNSESRRHLSMLMFPEPTEDYEELQEMLIDRSQLLEESFEYISNASVEALRHGLFMEFKNEEATGPGVLREWFFLVSKAIFNPQNALFVACPNDRRRFFPNPASKVDPMHLNYFKFSGRVIALALMHKVQIGIVFDRVFFLQLAGMCISLEDIRDADPYLYNSCKQILDMDANIVDSDALGLTFTYDFEELGTRNVLDLCPGGKDMVVNSKNREEYVKLLIENRFMKSVSEQISHFASGFTDILSDKILHECFFKNLEPEDLDWMLYGSESAISVEDWKVHTEYNGYKENDLQISWFWKIVSGMTLEQRKNLLFFWTSVKYLPVQGFKGLASKLYIYKSSSPCDHLPSSHTCFFRLCFPPYPTKSIMKSRLQIITQEHVGCSFGTW
ncbi:E3 ubiquitin-protein ligase UPL5-like isoform X1 [Cucurbita pepo subsp. pepo]|uniref:E3 ubiquitin-protein ligase UPL5-like isoform X1 n=1 Tax=Cucurbita pepo subsp. pepo TaxID=3664 RepID=UPI000C9D8199|nr:E3 ubiquitin-protein ligase UPL5-like isoform X1 [Cucurbita pepo subsp. pepo]